MMYGHAPVRARTHYDGSWLFLACTSCQTSACTGLLPGAACAKCTLFTTPSLTNAHGMYAEVLHLAFKALTIMEVPPFGEA